MAKHITLGQNGEDIAHDYMIKLNYNIVSRNLRIGRAEIDLVARDTEGKLTFIEVKSRTNYERPEEAVNHTKQRMLLTAAETFKLENNLSEEIFFDVIAIDFQTNGEYILTHFKDIECEN